MPNRKNHHLSLELSSSQTLFLISWHMLQHRADLISLRVMAFVFIWTTLQLSLRRSDHVRKLPLVYIYMPCEFSASACTCQCSNCLSKLHRHLTDLLLCIHWGKDVSSSQQPAATAAVCSAFNTVIKDVGLVIETLCFFTNTEQMEHNKAKKTMPKTMALELLNKGDRLHFWPLVAPSHFHISVWV